MIHRWLTYLIALVWLVNGLVCKILGLVPRHEQIVARIIGDEYSGVLTKAIGVFEIGIAVWVLSGIRSRQCAIFQVLLVAAMNFIEFALASDLLLFGRSNLVFAAMFCVAVYYNAFVISKRPG